MIPSKKNKSVPQAGQPGNKKYVCHVGEISQSINKGVCSQLFVEVFILFSNIIPCF